MGRKPNNYFKVLDLLKELHTLYPSFNMGRHLSTILEEYQDFWGLPDSELLYLLENYKATLEYNGVPIASDEEVERVLEDAKHLSIDSLYEESEEDY